MREINKMTYEMTKPITSAYIFIYTLGVIVILLGVFIFLLMSSSKNYSLEIKDKHIMIKSVFYNTNISFSDIELKNIEKINLITSNIKIKTRLNGIGLPGLQVGWFSSSIGKMKLYVTDKNEVLSIPTKFDYTILFSTKDADKIIKDIQTLN